MRVRTLLAAAALAGAALLGNASAGGPARAGAVTFLAGEATRASGGKSEKLAVGSAVYAGDVIETRRRTRVELRLEDQSVVRLGPLAKLDLAAASFGKNGDREVSVRLLFGNAWANVAKAVGGKGRFEVQTQNAVAGVRGTTFRVDASRDRSCVVKVYAGTVAVAARSAPRPDHGGAQVEGGPERRQVAGPIEVTSEQWEKIMTSMMKVRVSADGRPSEPEEFSLASTGADEWEGWNRRRDGEAR